MSVRRTDSVHLVPACIVAVVSAAMMRAAVAAGKTEERHGSHAGRSKHYAEDVKIHCSKPSKIFEWLPGIYRTTILLCCSRETPFSWVPRHYRAWRAIELLPPRTRWRSPKARLRFT